MDVFCQPMPNRLATFKVMAANSNMTLGFLRLDAETQKWIARTTGSATRAADLRLFFAKDDAIKWLRGRKPKLTNK